MLTTLLAALAFQSPNLEKPVTVRTVAKPVAEVLEDVTTQVGFRFEASQVRDWPIIVSVKSFRAGDLLDRIAEVTDSEWVKEQDRWVLTRSAARVKKAVEIELADRAARLKPVVDALPTEMTDADIEKAAAEIQGFVEQARQMSGPETAVVGGPSPAVVVLNTLIKRMPIGELAEAPISSFVSYSTSPQSGQRSLAAVPPQAWKRYLATRERFAKRITVPPNLKISGAMAGLSLPPSFHLVMTFSRPSSTANVIAGLYVVSDQGELLDMCRATLIPLAASADVIPAPALGKIEFGDASKAMLKALRKLNPSAAPNFRSVGGEMIPIHPADPWATPGNIALARQAIEGEPLAYHVSEWALDLADKSNKQLVAHVPEHAFTPMTTRLDGNADHDAVWKALPTFGIDRVVTKDALVLKPKMFARADRYRVNRQALRALVKSSGPHGVPKLRALMDYSRSAPRIAYADNLDITLLELVFRRNHTNLLRYQEQLDALRLLSQWKGASPDAEKLTLAEAVARHAEAYDTFVRAAVAARGAYTTMGGPNMPKIGEFDPFAAPPMNPDVPVIMHMGKPTQGVLLFLDDGKPVGLSPIGLGTFLGLRPENFTGFQPLFKISRIHPAGIFTHSLIFRAGERGVSWDFTDIDANLDQTWTIDQLPAEWRSEIERGREFGSTMKASIGSSGGTPPPP